MALYSDSTDPKRGIETTSESAEALKPCGSHCQTGHPVTKASSATVEYVNKMISALLTSLSRLPFVTRTRSCLIRLKGCWRNETLNCGIDFATSHAASIISRSG